MGDLFSGLEKFGLGSFDMDNLFDDEPKKVFRHYKELEEVGLAAPQITYIMQTLKAKGLAVDTDITGVEEARDAILKAIRG